LSEKQFNQSTIPMKKVFVSFAAVSLLFLGSSFLMAGPAGEEVRNLKPFDGIGISISADVHYTQGNTHQIRIEGDESDVKELITEVEDGFLKIRYEDCRTKRSKLTIYITSQEIEKVSLSGSAKFSADNPVNSDEMEIAISGSGEVKFSTLEGDEVDVKISGSGNVLLLKGTADEMDAKISGSGSLLAEQFEVSEFSAAISGSGTCKVTVKDELGAKLSGSGSVYYHGNPEVSSAASGSGKVKKL
jgi:hypothetical protein